MDTGKSVSLYYDDGQSVVRKDGQIVDEIANWIYLDMGDRVIAIARERIIRIEFKNGTSGSKEVKR